MNYTELTASYKRTIQRMTEDNICFFDPYVCPASGATYIQYCYYT